MSGYLTAYKTAGGLPKIMFQGEAFTAEQFCDFVGAHYPSGRLDVASAQLIAAVESALDQYPNSARLWCRLGDLLQTGATTRLGVTNELECYLKAASLDPFCGEAYQEIAFLLDIECEGIHEAITCFQQAIRCDGCVDSYLALARILSEAGTRVVANELLSVARGVFERILEQVTSAERAIATQ